MHIQPFIELKGTSVDKPDAGARTVAVIANTLRSPITHRLILEFRV